MLHPISATPTYSWQMDSLALLSLLGLMNSTIRAALKNILPYVVLPKSKYLHIYGMLNRSIWILMRSENYLEHGQSWCASHGAN